MRPVLAEWQIAPKHVPAMLAEFFGKGYQKRRVTVASGAVREYQAGASTACTVKKAANGRVGGIVNVFPILHCWANAAGICFR